MTGTLVMACDEDYAMPLATTLRSVTEGNRTGQPLEICVLSDGFSEQARRRVRDSLPRDSAAIRWVDVDVKQFGQLSTMPHVSKVTYARCLIPRIFEENVSRVLYLDADLLVLDDLTALWQTDLEGAVLGAVLDRLDARIKRDAPDVAGMPRVRNYFNAGVLLIDLNRWREERISEKALEYMARHPQSPFSDQDALNVACDGLWKELDPRWNFQAHYEKSICDMAPSQRPGIVHFVTYLKPWNASVLNINSAFYDAFRSRTRFSRTLADKLGDMLKKSWAQLKAGLKQYAFLQIVWNHLRRLRQA